MARALRKNSGNLGTSLLALGSRLSDGPRALRTNKHFGECSKETGRWWKEVRLGAGEGRVAVPWK